MVFGERCVYSTSSMFPMWPLASYMAKGSKKLVAWMFLFPLLCIVFIRLDLSPRNYLSGKIQANVEVESTPDEALDGKDYRLKFLIRELVRGTAKLQLDHSGVACVVQPDSTFCVTNNAVRITVGPTRSSTIYVSAGQQLSSNNSFTVRPYPRTTDIEAMQRTAPVHIVTGKPAPPLCDANHSVPAVIFSTGGFAGNFYHDISEVLMPLFITAGIFRSRVQLVITDYEPYWVEKFRPFLSQISAHEFVILSSPYGDVASGVHCYPAAVVGLNFHGHFVCNASRAPGGIDNLDFKKFLHDSFSLKITRLVAPKGPPRLMLVSRRKSRAILNEGDVIRVAKRAGFQVVLANEEMMTNIKKFSELVNSCSVLMGVHGAGLANLVFLPHEAILLQIVPLGLEWHAKTYFGQHSDEFGLKYVEYKAGPEESSLYSKYPKDHPILTDPWTINKLGYNVSKPLYIDGQNVTINVQRIRGALKQALALLPRSSS